MPPNKQPSPGPTSVHGATKFQKLLLITFSPPVSQSTPVPISSISAQSSLELDTEHSALIDETIKHVAHTLNQTLMTSHPCNANKNKDSINPSPMIFLAYNQPKM